MNKLYNYLTSNKVIRITLIVYFFSELISTIYYFINNYSQSTSSLISYLKGYHLSEILSLFLLIGLIISLLINTDILNNRPGKILIITYFILPSISGLLKLNEIYSEYYLSNISVYFYSILMFVLLIISFLSRHKLVFIISSVLIIISIGYLIPLFSPFFIFRRIQSLCWDDSIKNCNITGRFCNIPNG